jgi:thymidylate synthase (FAD)
MTEVRLIGITTPVVPECANAEDLVAYAARVSNPANQANMETAPKLLAYLVKNKHWSPFEMVHVVMEIKTTRAIAHQIVRHRSFSFQEFSQRYANANEMGFTRSDCRLQDTKNRQSSLDTDDEQLKLSWTQVQDSVLSSSKTAYNWAITNGIAKEVARNVLPEGMTNSVLYMSGSLRSWIHYCQLRCSNGTQKEHKEVADLARQVLVDNFPAISELI